jgi:cell division protein FtsB
MGLPVIEKLHQAIDRIVRGRRKIATAAVILLAVQVAWHVVFGANGFVVYQQKRNEHKRLLVETEQIQLENQRLEKHIQSLKSDPKTIEKEAREQLRYARPGEVVYTVPAPPPPQPPANATAKKQ